MMNSTSRKFRRRAFVSIFVVVSATLLMASSVWDFTTFPPPPGTFDYVASFYLGYLGLWDAAMTRARRAQAKAAAASASSSRVSGDDDNRMAAVHRRIASLHERVGRFDEAAKVMEREVLPRLRTKRASGHSSDDKDGAAAALNAAASVTRAQVWELAMSDLSELFRRRGLYRDGLKILAEAEREYDAAFPSPNDEEDADAKTKKSRFNDALSSLTQSTLQKEHDIRGEEMRTLAADLDRNAEYVQLVEELARKYEFSTRRRISAPVASAAAENTEDGGNESEAAGETCPFRERCSETVSRRILYAPSDALFGTILLALLLGPVRRSWSRLFHPPAPTKLSRVRRLLGFGTALFYLFVAAAYWHWSLQVDAARYNSLARVLGWRVLGRPAEALALFDAARCSILDNPREETVLTAEVVPETFAGAAFMLEELGEHDLADDLIGDVDDLLEVNAVLARPSFYVAGHYLRVGDMYWGRVSNEQRGGEDDPEGESEDDNGNDNDNDEHSGAWSKEVVALWRKEGRRYHALAESETRRLARYIEGMMEEELEKMEKEMKTIGGRHGGQRNTTLSSAADDGEEEDEQIEVRIDR